MSIPNQHVVATALAAMALCTAHAPGQADAESTYHRIYGKQPVPLPLDAGRVAVFDAAREAGAAPQLELAPYGIAPDQIEPWPITGWSLAAVPLGARNAAGVEALVSAVSRDRAADFVSPVFVGEDGGPLLVTPDILVGFRRNVRAVQAEAILLASEAGRIADIDYAGMSRVYRVRSAATNGFDVLEAANALAVRPEVTFAEPDMIFTGRGDAIPDDQGFLNCWGLHNVGLTPDNDMDAPQAWDVTIGDPSVIVAVIDTGIQQDHPDLNQIQGHDVTSQAILGLNGGPVSECDNHGTAVAGCISATINNGLGTVGVAPGCRTVSLRTFIMNMTCVGWTTQASWTVDALAWARDNGVRVSNNSNRYGFTSALIEQMYQDTYDIDQMVHFASAGNDSTGTPVYPASIPVVNACAALGMDGTLTSFSNWGPGLDFSAPGIRIYTTDRTSSDGYSTGDYTHVQGTSYASPYAAGVAALIISQFPALPAASIETIMTSTAIDLGDPGYDETYGWGFVNACAAVLGDCSEPCVPGGGDCDVAHGGLGCSDAGCCTRVCEIDPACCDTAWDQTCVDLAAQTCTPGSGTTTRVSVDSGGDEGDDNSFWPWLAADAPSLVAFDSRAQLDGDTNGNTADVFVHDTETHLTRRVSEATDGTEGQGDSWLCEISDDGRWVAFYSSADNLVADDTNTVNDAFIHDRQTSETIRVSISGSGEEGNNRSAYPTVTPDGRFVAFRSFANNLAPGDTNGHADVYVHDRDTDDDGIFDEPGEISTERVSIGSGGAQGDEHVDGVCPRMSADGRHVVFSSRATTLVPGDDNGRTDVFVHDRDTDLTIRVSVSSSGDEGDALSSLADMTPDGRYIVFRSGASTLVPGDSNGSSDVFVHDRDADTDGIFDEPGETSIEIVSVNSNGAQNNSGAGYCSISEDGRFVAFNSGATNLVAVDFNYWPDVFVHDRDTGETTLASHAMGGMADERSFWPSISADGRYLAFHSYATDLVAGDTNGFRDVFLTDRGEVVGACLGDLDNDGTVGAPDFMALLEGWGTDPGGPPDLNGDGTVGVLDLLGLLAEWGPCS